MSSSTDANDTAEASAVDALIAAWPRVVVADRPAAQRLARWWVAAEREATRGGGPALPQCAADLGLLSELGEARRRRQLERGLEAAEAKLAEEAAGLQARPATRSPAAQRISRLLVVSADGSDRFYRQVAALGRRHSDRVCTLMVRCDAERLGAAVFGRGQRARLVLLSHKDAVGRLFQRLSLVCSCG